VSVLATMLPALLPALSDGARAVFNRITKGKGAQPANVAEVVQLMQAENERLRVLQQMDAPGEVHKWVSDFRALERPALATLVLAAYAGSVFMVDAPETTRVALGELAGMVIFYLFGAAGWQGFTARK
jgi:hypothetical protein